MAFCGFNIHATKEEKGAERDAPASLPAEKVEEYGYCGCQYPKKKIGTKKY